jgi:hypothetical protein
VVSAPNTLLHGATLEGGEIWQASEDDSLSLQPGNIQVPDGELFLVMGSTHASLRQMDATFTGPRLPQVYLDQGGLLVTFGEKGHPFRTVVADAKTTRWDQDMYFEVLGEAALESHWIGSDNTPVLSASVALRRSGG